MVATLIGKGGENIRDLQDELGGMRLSVSSFSEMPDDVIVKNDVYTIEDRFAAESKPWNNKKGGRKNKRNRR
jgi:hypothetical protein